MSDRLSSDLLSSDWAVTDEAWRAAVEKALKGAPFDRLKSKTAEGLLIQPLYAASLETALPKARAGDWAIAQRIDHTDPQAANAQILVDLENGVGALELVFAGSPRAWFGGLPLDKDALKSVFDGVYLDLISLRVDAGAATSTAMALISEISSERGFDPAEMSILPACDPGALLASGAVVESSEIAPIMGCVTVDGRAWHEAGATTAQELALVLSSTVAQWRAGTFAEGEAPAMAVTLVAEADQFATIAKFRAAQLLFARLFEAVGCDPVAPAMHAETSWRTLTRSDPNVNMLRTTLAALSAGVGGAASLTVLPFTVASELADPFARRVARNTQSILLEESGLGRVDDPAAGSGAYQSVTDALAGEAWALFQSLEAAGGLKEALKAGKPQEWLQTSSATRQLAIATRKQPIIGTSLYPVSPDQNASVGRDKATLPVPTPVEGFIAQPIQPMREAEAFEALTDRAGELGQKLGQRPSVFLATLGSLARFGDRAAFAKGLFEAGGFLVPQPQPATTVQEIVAAFSASGAKVACIVGADDDYTQAADLGAELTIAGAKRVLIAARPENAPDGFVTEACVHLKVNAVDLLSDLLGLH